MTQLPAGAGVEELSFLRDEIQREISRLLALRQGAPPFELPQLDAQLVDRYQDLAAVDAQLDALSTQPPSGPPPASDTAAPPADEDEPEGVIGILERFIRDRWADLQEEIAALQETQDRQLTPGLNLLQGLAAAQWDVLDPDRGTLLPSLQRILDEVLPEDLEDLGAGIAGVRDQLVTIVAQDIPRAVAGAQEGVASALGQGLELALQGSAGLLSEVLGRGLDFFTTIIERGGAELLGPLLATMRREGLIPEELEGLVQEAENPTRAIGVVIITALIAGIFGALAGNVARGFTARAQWQVNALFLPRLLGQDDLVQLAYKRALSTADLWQRAKFLGIGADDFELMKISQERVPFIRDVHDLLNRGLVTEETARILLTDQGYTETMADPLLALRRFLPGPSDIIRFAVREALREDIVRDFQLDSDFPTNVVPLAQRVGLQEEDLALFWRAHWDLPSLSQAFEMFHRTTDSPIPGFSEELTLPSGAVIYRNISFELLQELLRVQDVMPVWREPLTRIAFTPFTRVDIRRFFRTGVLDLDGVVRAYTDIGYSPADALTQARFVVGLDVERTFDDVETTVRGQARAGVLSVQEAAQELAQVQDPDSGVRPPDRVLDQAVRRIEVQVEGDRREDLLRAYRSAFRLERVSEANLRQALAALGIVPDVIQHIVDVEKVRRGEEAAAEEGASLRASGRGTVLRRFRSGLIGEAQFHAEMLALGYTDLEAQQYLLVARLEADTEYRDELLQAALTAFRRGLITQAQLEDRLQDLGISPDLRQAYIEREIARTRTADEGPEQQEIRATGRGTVLRRYREGWIPPAAFREEMLALGYTDRESDQYQMVADLEFDYDWRQDILFALRRALREEIIDPSSFVDRLVALGMDAGRAQTHLARETAIIALLPSGE